MPYNPPALLLPWLTFQHRMTDKLHAAVGDARLQVLKQQQQTTTWWDRYVLKVSDAEIICREILIHAWSTPCWYARTVIPLSAWQQEQSFFERLQTESLGDLIFNSAEVKRVSFHYYPVNRENIEYHWLDSSYPDAAELWMRWSHFSIKDRQSFYLMEILLPGLSSCLELL